MKFIDEKDVFEKIAVRTPYYALKNLKQEGDEVKAIIPIEQPLEMEIPPITAAEAARHLAVLGSCAGSFCLNSGNEKRFYIATAGNMQRVTNNVTSKFPYLYGTAKSVMLNKRKAISDTRIETPEGEVIY
ncbi:hypothetical protein ACFL4S_01950, partial [bacterium]